jgi:hypothetical protein
MTWPETIFYLGTFALICFTILVMTSLLIGRKDKE